MDSITSGILLSAAMNGADNDRIAGLYKYSTMVLDQVKKLSRKSKE